MKAHAKMDTRRSKEDLIQEAKELTFGQGRKRFTPCPYGCGLVKATRFEEHLKRSLPVKPERPKCVRLRAPTLFYIQFPVDGRSQIAGNTRREEV